MEHALLPVRPDLHAEFEAAFARAEPLIAGMPGFRGLTLSRCLEEDHTYLLLVQWDELEDHTVGFRGSAEYQEWRRLLHSFYDPFPTVQHFETVLAAGDRPTAESSTSPPARAG
jgi:heme-degrading monooxygenase HmoA